MRHGLVVMPTPMGIAQLLLQPPWLYVLIALMALCCITGIICAFREQLQPYFFLLLDVLATVVRGVVAFGRGLYWCCAHISYPIKQAVIGCIDSVDRCMTPYKKRRIKNDVPSFNV
mmetsp:Transcript_22199/g.51864  ORF Transcript_22199/g.51864 Transcript_22199/m.51864 type:complete len:116 (+) Transcript_22199:212-559(+)